MAEIRKDSDKQKYVIQRRKVMKKVKKAKNEWLKEKADEVEVAVVSGGLSKNHVGKFERVTAQ